MAKEFMNVEKLQAAICEIYKDTVKSYGYDPQEHEDYCEERALAAAKESANSMRRYVHQADTHMSGNFCNIEQDWELTPEFIGSEVQPWGRFRDVVKSIDDETISDEDLAKWHQWAEDWFFRAFGTRGFGYNFGESFLCHIEEYEREAA